MWSNCCLNSWRHPSTPLLLWRWMKRSLSTAGVFGSTSHLMLNSSLVQKVLLKDVPELSNHIDRSQLTAPLGGYLIYCHQSWVSFIKVIYYFMIAGANAPVRTTETWKLGLGTNHICDCVTCYRPAHHGALLNFCQNQSRVKWKHVVHQQNPSMSLFVLL